MSKRNLHEVSRQWASRPNDERYLSLGDLRRAVARRSKYSTAKTVPLTALLPQPTTDDGIVLIAPDAPEARTTHWSFGQLAAVAGAPAGYLRELPANLACANLIHGLRSRCEDAAVSLYLDTSPDEGRAELRAITSTSYGRIHDLAVVDNLMRLNEAHGGRWVVPSASYADTDPKRATTLYASDRDIFLFLCDPSRPIEIPGQDKPSFRGFMVSNSEVGAGCFVLTCFLYETVCDNRIIWGASEVKELRMRHTSGAPTRFLQEARPALSRYAETGTKLELDRIKKAQRIRLLSAQAAGSADLDEIMGWMRDRTGITRQGAEMAVKLAKKEEGRFDTVWDAVQGVTAMARSITHSDQRARIEAAAGRLLG